MSSNDVDTSGSIDPNSVYKLAEAAKLLRVDKNTIYLVQSEGKLPMKKIGKGYKFLGEDLLRFMGSATCSDVADTKIK